MWDNLSVKALVGKTMTDVKNVNNEELVFTTTDGEEFKLYHDQSCCENVTVEDISGDLSDLVGSPILQAEESTSDTNPPDFAAPEYQDSFTSFTWTFYKFATQKGYVTIRWYGSSNGYYSESVSFAKTCDGRATMSKRPTQEQLNTAREVIEWFQEECEKGAPSPAIDVFQAALDNLPVEMTEWEKT